MSKKSFQQKKLCGEMEICKCFVYCLNTTLDYYIRLTIICLHHKLICVIWLQNLAKLLDLT